MVPSKKVSWQKYFTAYCIYLDKESKKIFVRSFTKKFVQKLYKMYTKIIKNIKLYIFCIQRLYKSKFYMIMNKQKMYITFLHIYKKMYKLYKICTKFRPKTACNLKCIFFAHTNNAQTIQNLYN